MERFEETLEALDARVKVTEKGYSTQYDKLYEMCRKIDLIEEELGISLEVLFNSEYVWTKSTRYKIHDIRLNKINKSISIYAITNGGMSTILESKNYKKIWAFNKEELE